MILNDDEEGKVLVAVLKIAELAEHIGTFSKRELQGLCDMLTNMRDSTCEVTFADYRKELWVSLIPTLAASANS